MSDAAGRPRPDEAARRKRKPPSEKIKARARERAKAWAEAHPEEMKARRDTWMAANQDRVRAHARAYYHRHKKERQAASRQQNNRRREDPEYRSKEAEYRAGRREVLNAQQNAQRKVDHRLHELGLPPRPKHRWTIDEKAEHEAALRAAANRTWTDEDVEGLQAELQAIRYETWRDSDRRWRSELEAQISQDRIRWAKLGTLVDAYLKTDPGKRLRDRVRDELRVDNVLRGLPGTPDPDAVKRDTRRQAADRVLRRAAETRVAEDDSAVTRIRSHIEAA